jgi:tetratricopeptide (TPR) repeat protein
MSKGQLLRRIGSVGWLILLAYALQLHALAGDSLWGDEILTATQAPLPVGQLLHWTAGDIHPPGYYLLVGGLAHGLGWAGLPPSALTDWLWRFPSVLAGILAVALTYRLGAATLGRWAGLGGALLLAVNPVVVQYGQEARMHQLFLLGAALSTWTLARALRARENMTPATAVVPALALQGLETRFLGKNLVSGPLLRRPGQRLWWLGYALATALSLYTVYLAFVVLAAQAGWVLALQIANRKSQIAHTKSQILNWALALLLALALYLPWWPSLLRVVSRRLATGGGEPGVGAPLAFLMKGIYSLGPAAGWPAWLFLAVWAVGLASLILSRRPALALFGGLWLALPLALPLVFRDPRALHVRYVFLLPVYLMFVAQGALVLAGAGFGVGAGLPLRGPAGALAQRDLVPGKRGNRRGLPLLFEKIPELRDAAVPALRLADALVLLALALASAFYLPEYYGRSKPDWRGAAAYLAARTIPGDVIVTGPLFDVGRYLDYYYAGPAEVLPPALLVATLPDRLASMRISGGRVWAVTRFQPAPVGAMRHVRLAGLTISEPVMALYDPGVLTEAMIDLMQQAVAAAPGWAADMSAQGVLDPDPLVARAAAYLFLGDVYRAAGRLPEAISAYEAMVADAPASAGGYLTLADAYEAAGRPEDAVGAYQRAVALNPTWQGPRAQAAAQLADAERWGESAAAYRTLVNDK